MHCVFRLPGRSKTQGAKLYWGWISPFVAAEMFQDIVDDAS